MFLNRYTQSLKQGYFYYLNKSRETRQAQSFQESKKYAGSLQAMLAINNPKPSSLPVPDTISKRKTKKKGAKEKEMRKWDASGAASINEEKQLDYSSHSEPPTPKSIAQSLVYSF